ncbi:hypothetical protein [Flagellimonas marinaquae]|uniref:hypothetical protein n=1 Tax=Flagellimonas marinaquae TaxID=254955 RepID=UPI000F8E79E4|nr:hypothetical protein [Allomuricauda aquimarina]
MKSNKILYLTFICFSIIACNEGNNRKDNLEQVRICLKAKEITSRLFNQRNKPLAELVAEAKIDKYGIDKSRFANIDSLTTDLSSEIKHYIQLIETKSENVNDIEFYKATEKYLKIILDLESSISPFLQTLKDTIKGNEEVLSVEVKEKALGINAATREWEDAESSFFERYEIKQATIDSIVKRLKRTNVNTGNE